MKRLLGGLAWNVLVSAVVLLVFSGIAQAQAAKPNILVIWGDDIGVWNISHNNRGMMGYRTPNIDRIAREGLSFTDYYGQQSCTAGCAAFIGGNVPVRTGMTKVGLPGAKEGWQTTDVTIATVLKSLGYATGQFGKNHQGDRDEHLPTNHGFDEFMGNLYHLNAEEEPENRDYPKDPEFRNKFGPRGVMHSWANADGTQKIQDAGPLTRKRMETVDDETLAAATDFIQRQQKAGKPWFTWWNGTRMHFRTHVRPEHIGISGPTGDDYQGGMVEHDRHVGQLLKLIDDLGIADNTIVFYSTDNGVHFNTWPDAGNTMFRSEKNSNWEGAYRVPAFVRWPGHFAAGETLNGIISHEDWLPTLATTGGDPNIKDKLAKGTDLIGRKYRNHIDGYDQLDYFSGKATESPRKEFIYVNDDGQVVAMRYDAWKAVFIENMILQFSSPKELHIVDITLAQFRRDVFASAIDQGTVRLHESDWVEALRRFPDGYFDWIYIDANHSYAGVKRDIEEAKQKVKRNGLLVFNDYIFWSHREFMSYGVVHAVNEFCLAEDWELLYLALHPEMYADVVLRKT